MTYKIQVTLKGHQDMIHDPQSPINYGFSAARDAAQCKATSETPSARHLMKCGCELAVLCACHFLSCIMWYTLYVSYPKGSILPSEPLYHHQHVLIDMNGKIRKTSS